MALPNSNYATEALVTTLRGYSGKLADNIITNNALTYALKEKGRIKTQRGGSNIEREIMYAENSLFQRYRGMQQLAMGEVEAFTVAQFDPVQAFVPIVISGRDMRINNGDKYKIVDLWEARITNAETSMSNMINNDALSSGALDEQMGGLQLIIADDPTTNTSVGGINQNTYSFWRNKVYDFSSASVTASTKIKTGMNNLYLQCTFGKEQPDIILADDTFYTYYESSLQEQQRFTDEKSAGAGFQTLRYKAAKVFYENAANMLDQHMYFINSKHLELVAYQGANFDISAKKEPYNQDAMGMGILFMGNLVTDGRRFHGVLKA